jgi:PKD repeat protein
MKKLLLSSVAFLSLATSLLAQQIKPCGTYEAREYYLKNLPGYAAKLNTAENAARAEYEAFLKSSNTSKTSSVQPTYTVPVVFHVLHKGETPGTGSNINDQLCIDALAQVNRDFSKQNSDTVNIDPLYQPLYKDAKIKFVLAKKDPNGNCTSGIVHHNDPNTTWYQSELLNYQYSTMASGNWNPTKYLNIYIVSNIIPSGSALGGGIMVGYTHLPGTSPDSASDAIVYRNDFLSGLDARYLSHEIGHWFGLIHTFGAINNLGFECGNDDIYDTPATTGFFSACPKPASYSNPPAVSNPTDGSDIINVKFGKMSNTTAVNSLTGTMIRNLFTMVATTVTPIVDTTSSFAVGTAGGYSDFSNKYGNDFNRNTTNTLSITSLANSAVSNYAAAYIDYNKDGDFLDVGETVLTPTGGSLGTQTFTSSVLIPSSTYSILRLRVMTSDSPITSPNMSITSGEIEDYNLNIGTTPSPTTGISRTMATCDSVRPNFENIMDYSTCPRMFTIGQINKMRLTCESSIAFRDSLVGIANLIFTGILDANGNPTGVTPCAPIADFASNKSQNCAGQTIIFTSTSYNSLPNSYSWVFEGGSPSTSTLSTQTVTYSTPGNYSVSLTASNANGSSTKDVNSFINVNWNSARQLPFSENFESGQWWPDGFVMINEDFGTPSWEMSNYGALGSSKSVVLANANYVSLFPGYAKNIDIMETPTFDFSNITGISFSFDYSFARKSTVDAAAETFKLQYSTDCGGSWLNMPSTLTASVMANSGGVVNIPYIPWSTIIPNPKWVNKFIPPSVLSALNNKRDVKFRFWFQNDVTGGQSQNLYIDNINISGTVGLNEFENSLALSIYPNPTNSSSVVEFTSPTDSKVNIIVYDVTGREVESNTVTAIAGINTKYTVNSLNKFNSGIYFITINIDNYKLTKKLIIE